MGRIGPEWFDRPQGPNPPHSSPPASVGILRASNVFMKFLKVYLIGYFILLVGAGLALWQSGILDEIPGIWLAIGLVVAVGLGIMLAVASSPRAITTTTTRDV